MTREALSEEHGLFQSMATAGSALIGVIELGYYQWLMSRGLWGTNKRL
jgi:hypothetical protein